MRDKFKKFGIQYLIYNNKNYKKNIWKPKSVLNVL